MGNLDSGSNEAIWGDEIDEKEIQKKIILQERAEIRELNATVMNYQGDELVFSFSIDDFVDSFNFVYSSTVSASSKLGNNTLMV